MTTMSCWSETGVVVGERCLTVRQLGVLNGVAAGKSNSAIAKELNLAEQTVARHVGIMLIFARVSNRAGLVAWAFRSGLLSIDENTVNSGEPIQSNNIAGSRM
ncbi:response regulator transcription factor [Kineococcus sp. SYSU DK018]|uniref:response regulator transcription factor n=1 Tax=Kineococcus sp. SYSU DK018 TaxID=3383139 RepID=UPI003D7CE859